jgi:hypothetical protein
MTEEKHIPQNVGKKMALRCTTYRRIFYIANHLDHVSCCNCNHMGPIVNGLSV